MDQPDIWYRQLILVSPSPIFNDSIHQSMRLTFCFTGLIIVLSRYLISDSEGVYDNVFSYMSASLYNVSGSSETTEVPQTTGIQTDTWRQ